MTNREIGLRDRIGRSFPSATLYAALGPCNPCIHNALPNSTSRSAYSDGVSGFLWNFTHATPWLDLTPLTHPLLGVKLCDCALVRVSPRLLRFFNQAVQPYKRLLRLDVDSLSVSTVVNHSPCGPAVFKLTAADSSC